jgi:DNA repair protein RadA/Sms
MNRNKNKSLFVCQTCAYTTFRWLGRCPECGGWNTFTEETTVHSKPSAKTKVSGPAPIAISRVNTKEEERISTSIHEFDRVLGGGIVPGSAILMGGAPGIGKSTLLLQAGGFLADLGKKVLYISGEESLQQIKLRADRIGVSSDTFFLVSETDVEQIILLLENEHPDLAIIDSIQTVYFESMESIPGNISQVRFCGHRLVTTAKQYNIPVFLVGHVTKEGSLAGPRVLEHLVDCLLFLEGDGLHPYRLLRTVKNRFGSTNEVGLFEMTGQGIKQVENPSAYLISQKQDTTSGTVVTVTIEGSRPLLIEVQALVTQSNYGLPQRTANGYDHRRLSMLLAVLEKKIGMRYGNQDVFVNVAGGIRLQEPSADLAIITALVSSLREGVLPSDIAVVGEVGLTGEVRGITYVQKRVSEAERLGFKRLFLPESSMKGFKYSGNIDLIPVQTVEKTIEEIFK